MCPHACGPDNTAQPTARGYTLTTGQAQREPPNAHTGVQSRPGSCWGRRVPGHHVEKASRSSTRSVSVHPSRPCGGYFSISDNGAGLLLTRKSQAA